MLLRSLFAKSLSSCLSYRVKNQYVAGHIEASRHQLINVLGFPESE